MDKRKLLIGFTVVMAAGAIIAGLYLVFSSKKAMRGPGKIIPRQGQQAPQAQQSPDVQRQPAQAARKAPAQTSQPSSAN